MCHYILCGRLNDVINVDTRIQVCAINSHASYNNSWSTKRGEGIKAFILNTTVGAISVLFMRSFCNFILVRVMVGPEAIPGTLGMKDEILLHHRARWTRVCTLIHTYVQFTVANLPYLPTVTFKIMRCIYLEKRVMCGKRNREQLL